MDVKKFTFTRDERDICLLDLLPQLYHPIQDFQAISNLSGEEVRDLYAGVEYIFDNSFISTSSESTLAKWEDYLRITPNGTDSVEERRFRILAKLKDLPPYTDKYLENKLTELCGVDNFRIFRQYDQYKLIVEITLDSISKTDTVADIVRSIVPANLDVSIGSYRSRHYELEPMTHATLAGYTHEEIMYRDFVRITKQPESVSVASGEMATVTFEAIGTGLTYKWYYKDTTQSKFYPASTYFDSNTYSIEMTDVRNGRQLYCVVTDDNGYTAQTDTVTISMTE